MNDRKVFLVVAINVMLAFSLCDCDAIKSKRFVVHGLHEGNAERGHFSQPRQPRSVSNVNETVSEEDDSITSMRTEKPLVDIKIVDQKYSQNTSGEYKHEVLFSDGAWRAEQGEYEDHNGVIVFVIRGVFSYNTRQGTYNTTLYIVDEYGYHNVLPPPQLTPDGGGLVDYRPDVPTTSDCSSEEGSYCIDPKLLALLVG